MINLSEKEVADRIHDFERKEVPFSLMVEGICIWRVIRASIFNRIQSLGLSREKPRRIDKLTASIVSVPGILRALIQRSQLRYGVISYPFALRVEDQDGSYSDFYYQSILDTIPGGIRLSNNLETKRQRKHRRGTININLSLLNLLAKLLSKIFLIDPENKAYTTLADMVKREFSVHGFDESKLRKGFSFFWWESRLKGILFRCLGLEFIIIVNSGEYSTINACLSHGIKIIELQHGIYTVNHPNVLDNDIVITYGKRSLFLPDIIAPYGDYWVNQLASTYQNSEVKLIAVGNDKYDTFRAKRNENYHADSAGITILVTTQGIQRAALVTYLNDFLRLCSSNVSLIIKLHPIYDKDRGIYLDGFRNDARVQIISGDESPSTFDLLSIVDLHASIASSCHYDALSIGVPTIIIGLSGSELMMSLIENGSGVKASCPTEMAEIVELRNWVIPTEEMRDYYCSPGFMDNIKELM